MSSKKLLDKSDRVAMSADGRGFVKADSQGEQEVEKKESSSQVQDGEEDASGDEILSRVGGFGRFQVLVTVLLTVARNNESLWAYAFAYLILKQDYLCKEVADGPYVSCSTEQICLAKSQGIEVDYRVDSLSSAYFENWFVQMDLMCTNPFTIGLILTLHMLTLGISGMFLAWVPDFHGRKKTLLIALGFSLLFQILAICIDNFYFRMACFSAMGACCIKNGTSYAWLFEMVESRHKPIVCSIVNAFDTMTLFFVGFYVIFISRQWMPLYVFYTGIGCVSWILLFFIPESPQWYLQSAQKNKAIEAFNKIARINNSTKTIPMDATFKECQEEHGDTVSMRSFIPSVAGMSAGSFVLQSYASHRTYSLARTTNQGNNKSTFNQTKRLSDDLTMSKHMSNATSRVSRLPYKTLFFLLVSIMTAMSMTSFLVYFEASLVDGDIFVNLIVVGMAELVANIISGILITKLSLFTAFRFLASSSILLHLIIQYGQLKGILSYVVLFFAIVGMGGAYNCAYFTVQAQSPPEKLGTIFNTSITVGNTASGLVSLICVLPMPIPLFAIIVFLSCTIACTIFLSRGIASNEEIKSSLLSDRELMNENDDGFGLSNSQLNHSKNIESSTVL